MRRALLLALAVASMTATAAPLAHAAVADFNDVEAALMCDTCNVPLPIAQSPRADQERAQIRRLIAQGKSRQEILDQFVAEYGPNVLADPKGGSASVAVWLVPTVILVAALLGLVLLLPRWKRRRRTTPDTAPTGALSKDDEERLERDLALYDL